MPLCNKYIYLWHNGMEGNMKTNRGVTAAKVNAVRTQGPRALEKRWETLPGMADALGAPKRLRLFSPR